MIDVGYSDSIATKKALSIPDLDWENDFSVKECSSSTKVIEMTLINLTSPIGRVEQVKTTSTKLQDVFSNAGIQPAYTPASREGVKLYSQVSDVYRYTDSDGYSDVHLPLTASVSVTIPNTEVLSAEDVLTVIGRAVSSLFDTGSTDSSRVNRAIKGSVQPKSAASS